MAAMSANMIAWMAAKAASDALEEAPSTGSPRIVPVPRMKTAALCFPAVTACGDFAVRVDAPGADPRVLDDTVRLLDGETLRVKASYEELPALPAYLAALAADTRLVVVGYEVLDVPVYDLRGGGAPLRHLHVRAPASELVRFGGGSSSRLAMRLQEGTLAVWDVEAGEQLAEVGDDEAAMLWFLVVPRASAVGVGASEEGVGASEEGIGADDTDGWPLLLSAAGSLLQWWDMGRRACVRRMDVGHDLGCMRGVVLSGNRLAVAGSDDLHILVLDMATGGRCASLPAPLASHHAPALWGEDRLLVPTDQRLLVWDVRSYECVSNVRLSFGKGCNGVITVTSRGVLLISIECASVCVFDLAWGRRAEAVVGWAVAHGAW